MNACAMGSLTSGEQGVGQCANGETKWRQPVASSACCLPQGSRSSKMLPTSSSEPNLQHRGHVLVSDMTPHGGRPQIRAQASAAARMQLS